MKTEGYIKYNCDWIEEELPADIDLYELNFWRSQLYNLGLIGVDKEGIGFGNISMRYQGNSFIISGTATGHLSQLTRAQYTIVKETNVEENRIQCVGPIVASSESLTHGVVYQEVPEVKAVVHVHHSGIWHQLKGRVPTSAEGATFGSAEMAREMRRILQTTSIVKDKIMVMGGHQDGLIGLGKDFLDASNLIIRLRANFFA